MDALLRLLQRSAALLMIIYPVLLGVTTPAIAQSTDCSSGVSLTHAFSSGATWSLCAQVDDDHGLEVSDVFYRAPGNFTRQVLLNAHLGQILLHYHDVVLPEPQITPVNTDQDTGQERAQNSLAITMNSLNCSGKPVLADPQLATPNLCVRVKNNRILAKYAQRPSLHSQSWELVSAFERDFLTWSVGITFTEDGQIIPAVTLSGKATRTNNKPRYAQPPDKADQRVTRATILSTWRLVFALDTDAADRIEQLEFPLQVDQGNRRPMKVNAIETETMRKVHRENFRGWRVVDGSGAGYYLDPANSGFSYRNQSMNWAQFDIAVTRYKSCERHALLNNSADASHDAGIVECGTNLDEFVDGETIQGAHPVIWYSQSRSFRPSQEDWPVISNVHLSFNLMPFDWTSSSPFEVSEQ